MTREQLHVLQHALGLDEYGHGKMYRNHFCAGGEDVAICQSLIELGYMRQHRTTEVFPDFNCSVTEAGKEAVRRESPQPPKLTRGQLRYRRWLDVADAYGDMSFGEWLKLPREVRR